MGTDIIQGLQSAARAEAIVIEVREDVKEIKKEVKDGFFELKASVKQDLDRFIEKKEQQNIHNKEETLTSMRVIMGDVLQPIIKKQEQIESNIGWMKLIGCGMITFMAFMAKFMWIK